MKIFLDVPRFFVRPKNTDWRYVRYNLPRLSKFCSGIETILPASLWYGWEENFLYVGHRLLRNSAVGKAMANKNSLNIPDRAVRRTGAELVFAHGRFPQNCSLPVVWQNGILDPAMQRARGVSEADLIADRKSKAPLFERSAAVQVGTKAEAERLGDWMPHIRHKFLPVPFFLPDLQGAPREAVSKKHTDAQLLKVLFVGNEAYRKGLDIVVQAFARLDAGVQKQLRLDVVSSMADGRIELPAAENVVYHGTLQHSEVMRLMSDAHIFVMPSRFESYGLTYIEALALGAVPIGPNWENQRDILANGRAGVLTDGTVANVAAAMDMLARDATFRMQLALAGHSRFEEEYEASRVAARYFWMFDWALHQ